MNIYIYGVPGSGKTTLSKLLGESLGRACYEADTVRAAAQAGKTSDSDPFYFLPTTEAYKAIGERTPENVINGLLEVRRALGDFVEREVSLREDAIIEASFLDPVRLMSSGRMLLLTIPSESLHRERFLVHRTEKSFLHGQFENARIIQEFLIAEADRLAIDVVENTGDLNDLMERTLKLLFRQ
ncbi:MAG: hypothetical protein HGB37_01255 [Candidatus Moranbacteria bacterium]|nr:hypothetical protein [Candidatus Moranbacteria bacterium]NTW89526.1 hypothetical protein [Candidatus Moranbacteria bacterium]